MTKMSLGHQERPTPQTWSWCSAKDIEADECHESKSLEHPPTYGGPWGMVATVAQESQGHVGALVCSSASVSTDKKREKEFKRID